MSKVGTTEHWCVIHLWGEPSIRTASYTRRGAIRHWIEFAGDDWKHWYRRGMRVRLVKIKWQVMG